MQQATVENLCGLLVTSRLYKPEEVGTIQESWTAEAKDPNNIGQFLRWLVARQYLTGYQADQVRLGHVEHLLLGPYKLLERLGQGRMAGVFKAVHVGTGQVVAIKVLPLAKAQDKQILGRFQREAKLAIQLQHPAVVRTFHVGESGGRHFLVMEYLEGDTVEALLKARPNLPVEEACRIAFITALGLQHIHEKGMVHRDLKPANLMLCPMPESAVDSTVRSMVKILDIGLGKELFDASKKEAKDEVKEMTVQGFALGAPAYAAPEQTRDARTVDIRADIYSLGCTLYHMLAGQPPFNDPNPVVLVLKHASDAPPPLPGLNPQVPEALNRVVLTMLAKDPAQRYRTPGHAAEALKAFLPVDASVPSADVLSTLPPELRAYLEWLQKEVAIDQSAHDIDLDAAATARGPSSGRRLAAKIPSGAHITLPPADVGGPTAPFGLPVSRDVFMLLAGVLAMAVIGLLIYFLVLAK
jgi:serine/threonine protein kinase